MNKLNYEDFQDKDEIIDNIEDVFKQTIVDLKADVQRPPLAISIGLDDREYKGIRYPLKFGSLGNISLIFL